MRLLACLTALAVTSLLAQKLETQQLDTTKVIRVETARDHLTVIEAAGPVTMVAVGNQNAFSIERRDNKVFVRPAEEDSRTNLFIWTSAGRFAYELVPAPSVDQMHFAIDQVSAAVVTTAEEPVSAAPLPSEMLIGATPISVHGERDTQGRVEITLRDLYRRDGRVYLRYIVVNHSGGGYYPVRPAVHRWSGVRSATSLISLRGGQLGEKLARSLKVGSSVPLEVLDADQPAYIAAGDSGLGWLVIETPANGIHAPVLKVEFAADAKGAVQAVLVLKPVSDRPEVPDASAAHAAASQAGNR